MDKKNLFYLGGFISIASYVLIIASLWLLLAKPFVPKKQPTMAVSTLTVTLQDDLSLRASNDKQSKKSDNIEKLQKAVEEKSTPSKKDPKPTDKPQKEHSAVAEELKKVTAVSAKQSRQEEEPSQYQQSQRSSAKSILQSLSVSKIQSFAKISLVGKDISDEYFAKIAQIVQTGWSPIASDVGLQAVVLVSIEPSGAFVWKIKIGSPNQDFNRRLAEYFKALQAQGFPPTKEGRNVSAEFIFKAKE